MNSFNEAFNVNLIVVVISDGVVVFSALMLLVGRQEGLPLSSDRQHLSCDVCLEVRGEIIRTVLFCIVY